MTPSLNQFVDDLSAAGVVSADAISAAQHSLPAEARPQDASDLAKVLVRTGHLTKYQANHALHGKARSLVYGEYVVLDQIDTAGETKVFKAEHRRLKRTVAIRLFSRSLMNSSQAVAQFHQVVQAAARLAHPHVVAALDAGESGGVHFLVMEFVDGHDLAAISRERGPLPVGEALNYVTQAGQALVYAHERGVVHGDIKPSNLLLHHDGTLKILELGLAGLSHLAAEQRTTSGGTAPDEFSYLAPEVSEHARPDARSDVYALGAVLCRLLSGPRGAKAANSGDAGPHRSATPLTALRAARGDLPEPLLCVIEKMTARRPEERYLTMKDALAGLAGCSPASAQARLGSTGSETVPLAAAPTIPLPAAEKSKHLALKFIGAVSATVVAPVIVALVLKYLDSGQPPPAPDSKSAAATNGKPALPDPAPAGAGGERSHPEATAAVDSATPADGKIGSTATISADASGPPNGTQDRPEAAGWLDVLPTMYLPLDRVKFGNQIGENRWELAADGLRYLPDGKPGKVRLPVEPRGDVEIRLEFTALAGKFGFAFQVPCGDGWVPIGIQEEGATLGGNRYPAAIAKDKRTAVDLKISHAKSRDEIVATADGQELFRWSGQGNELAKPLGPAGLPNTKSVNLWCGPVPVVFHRLRVRGHDASAVLSRRGTAPPALAAPFDAAAARAGQNAWAHYLKVPVEFGTPHHIRFALIPPGAFQMGLSPDEAAILDRLDSKSAPPKKHARQMTPHKVLITRPFYLSIHETTIGQFKAFAEDAEYKTQAEKQGTKLTWRTPGYPHPPRLPVTDVNFADAAAMCNWLDEQEKLAKSYNDDLAPIMDPGPQYRLPTEAEWEYACRAGTESLWWFGADPGQGKDCAWVSHDQEKPVPTIVGEKRRPNPFGLFDMHGNVWEMCQDVFDGGYYGSSPAADPQGPSGSKGGLHVIRGGGCDRPLVNGYSAQRLANRNLKLNNMTGFRLVKEL